MSYRRINTIKRIALTTNASGGTRERYRTLILSVFPSAHVYIGSPIHSERFAITVSGTQEDDEWEALETLQGLFTEAVEDTRLCKCGHPKHEHWGNQGCRVGACKCRRFKPSGDTEE